MTEQDNQLIDIGANLGHESFRDDLQEVLSNAQKSGIKHILLTGCNEQSSQDALALAQTNPQLLSSTAGVHPHDAKQVDSSTMQTIKQLCSHNAVKAVGETGLDFNRDYSPRPIQEKVYAQQLELACELSMPVFLHERDAHKRFYGILKEYRDRLKRGVVHCFTGSKEALYSYLDLDLFIGITGWVCDERRGKHLHPLLKEIPLNRLMIETDAPYLLPRSIKPKTKSRRNEPKYLPHILHTIARCLQIEREILAHHTSANACEFFALKEILE